MSVEIGSKGYKEMPLEHLKSERDFEYLETVGFAVIGLLLGAGSIRALINGSYAISLLSAVASVGSLKFSSLHFKEAREVRKQIEAKKS